MHGARVSHTKQWHCISEQKCNRVNENNLATLLVCHCCCIANNIRKLNVCHRPCYNASCEK
uniref:Uncharacterized protein n=1 Tax=Arundo donax TaxID=35708 RepID=A0A0A9FQI8_ARUDO